MNDLCSIDGDLLRVHFNRFDIDAYDLFLRVKRLPESTTVFHPQGETYTVETPARFARMLGLDAAPAAAQDLPLAEFLFDDQRAILGLALAGKRFACWSDCGLGKTPIGLEYARQVVARTAGRVLIVTLNEIVPQWIQEAEKFYKGALPLRRLASRAEMIEWMRSGPESLAITNYEKWNPEGLSRQVVSEARLLAGIVLDESSRLKTGGGRQKWSLIKSCRGIEYKLSLTATPAPNDTMEFASQAAFLEKMRSEGEIIWTYFVRDPKSHRWTVKAHAREQFFRFLAGWSIYVRDPRRYGWRLTQELPPEPVVLVHELAATAEQAEAARRFACDSRGQGLLFGVDDTNAIQRNKLSQIAKGFVYKKGGKGAYDRVASHKPGFVAGLIGSEARSGRQVLVWTSFDAEAEILAAEVRQLTGSPDFDVLTGKTGKAERQKVLQRFRGGECPVLITRAAVLGYGMNLQCCTSMIFSGWSDSYESYYQAVRRAYRHGQRHKLRVHVPIIPSLEGDQWDNLCRKQGRHEEAIGEMERHYIEALKEVACG